MDDGALDLGGGTALSLCLCELDVWTASLMAPQQEVQRFSTLSVSAGDFKFSSEIKAKE